nr:MAG TPA: SprT-like family protein [Caudoviricetes sp.]
MQVEILGVNYEIKELDIIDENPNVLGQIVYQKQQIEIKKSLKKDMKNTTIIHEMIHGILFHSGKQELNKNEDLIESLSNSIYQILKSNKKLITSIF